MCAELVLISKYLKSDGTSKRLKDLSPTIHPQIPLLLPLLAPPIFNLWEKRTETALLALVQFHCFTRVLLETPPTSDCASIWMLLK